MAIIPEYLKLHSNIYHDESIDRLENVQLPCNICNTEFNLSSRTLIFTMNTDSIWCPSSEKSGFLCTIKYEIQKGGADDKDAKITLASNFFLFMFQKMILRVGMNSTIVEEIQSPGLISDLFLTMSNKHMKESGGIGIGFVPDTGNGLAEVEKIANKIPTAGNEATVITYSNALKLVEFPYEKNNKGF